MKKIFKHLIVPISIIAILFVTSYIDFYGLRKTADIFKTEIFNASDEEELQTVEILSLKGEPCSDEEGLKKEPYTMRVKNDFTYNIRYYIYLKENSIINKLETKQNKVLDINDIKISINDKIIFFKDVEKNNFIIYDEVLKPKEEKYIEIRLWVDEMATHTKDKQITLKVYTNINRENQKLITHLKTNSYNQDKYYIDTDAAGEMYKFKDSYRFIGLVPKNYIYFNCENNNLNSCELWRIVSIEKVLLNSLETKYRVKIVSDNIIDKYKYDSINYTINNNYIEEVILNKDTLYKQTNYGLLTINDYRYLFSKGYDEECFKNILKCHKDSYLDISHDEWLNVDSGKYVYISKNKNVVKTDNNALNYIRPVVYLKENVELVGGDGSYETPYFIK